MFCSSCWTKFFFPKACFACVFLLFLLTHAPKVFASATEQIRIITTNDLHSYLKPIYYRYLDDIKPWGKVSREGDYVNKAKIEGKIGGMAHVASMIKKLKAEKPGKNLVFDAGDTWHGGGITFLTRALQWLRS